MTHSSELGDVDGLPHVTCVGFLERSLSDPWSADRFGGRQCLRRSRKRTDRPRLPASPSSTASQRHHACFTRVHSNGTDVRYSASRTNRVVLRVPIHWSEEV